MNNKQNSDFIRIQVILFVFFLFILSVQPSSAELASPPDQDQVEQFLQSAENLIYQGYIDSLLSQFEQYAQYPDILPDSSRYRMYIYSASAHLIYKQIDSSQADLRKAEKLADLLYPPSAENRFDLYEILFLGHINKSDGDSVATYLGKLEEIIAANPQIDPIFKIRLLNLKGLWFRYQGKYQESEQAYLTAIPLKDSVTEKNGFNKYQVSSLIGLSLLYEKTAEYLEAEKNLDKAYTLIYDEYGDNHIIIGSIYNHRGFINKELSNYTKADSCYNLSKSIFERYGFTNHPNYEQMLNNMAVFYWTIGQYSKVESTFKQIIEHQKSLPIINHELLGAVYINLANLFFTLGRQDEVIEYYEKTLAIWKEVYEEGHYNYSKLYNNMSVVYGTIGNHETALEYQLKALKIRESTLGPDNTEVALTLSNLAHLYRRMGKYKEGEPLLQRALKIRQSHYGDIHRHVAKNQLELAGCYLMQNIKHQEAESLLTVSLAARKRMFNKYHPEIVESYDNLAHFYMYQKQFDSSIVYFRKVLKARQEIANYIFSFTTEQQKLQWLDKNSLLLNSVLYLALTNDNQAFKTFALEMILKAKAIISSSTTANQRFLACGIDGNDEVSIVQKKYIETCEEIAKDVLKPQRRNPGDKLTALFSLKDSLEIEITRVCSEFTAFNLATNFEIEQITNSLTNNDILWEFVTYQPIDTTVYMETTESSKSEYMAVSLNAQGGITATPIGLVDSIDSLVLTLRNQFQQTSNYIYTPNGVALENDIQNIAGELYHQLITPLQPTLSDKQQVYISPEGQLNLLPFEVLFDDSMYFIEDYHVCYLNSGRELLSFKTSNNTGEILIFADPEFVDPFIETSSNSNQLATRESDDCLQKLHAVPLKYTRIEGEAIAAIAKRSGKSAKTFFGDSFREETVKGLKEVPAVLHLATHGYYCIQESDKNGGSFSSLNSGLLFSGANTAPDVSRTATGDDGILTALEVVSLNLHGTSLVTIPACNTGVGDIVSGEGVIGLRRSFINAGSQAMVLSLWSIPDETSHQIMTSFYADWWGGSTKNKALRDAMLKQMQKAKETYGHSHPLLWGGFIQVGNPE